MQWLWIALGGGAGSVLRYAVARASQPWASSTFAPGTLAVNITGSFLVGLLAAVLVERTMLTPALRTGLIVGVLGGYTTFSTFSLETLQMMDNGEWWFAAANVGLSVLGALAAVWAGQHVARL